MHAPFKTLRFGIYLFLFLALLGVFFVCLFFAAHRLCLLVVSGGYSPVSVRGLLIAVASLVSEHGL